MSEQDRQDVPAGCAELRALAGACSLEALVRHQAAILDNAGYAIVTTTLEGVVTSFNRTAEKMLGYRADEVVGKVTPALWHDQSEVIQRSAVAGVAGEECRSPEDKYIADFVDSAEERPDEAEWTYIRKDGSRFPVLLSVTKLRDESGVVTGLLGMAVDITEKKEAERRLQEANQRYEQLNVALEQRVAERTCELTQRNEELQRTVAQLENSERMASLGELVASVTHDLNTPIANGLLASTALLEDTRKLQQAIEQGLLRSDLEKYLNTSVSFSELIHRNLSRAARLIESFKHVAVDQTSVQRRVFNVAQVIGDVLDTLEPTLKRAKVEVHTQLDDALEMDSYPGPLGQVVANLVNNAVAHAFDDGLQGHVWVTLSRDDEGMCLDVYDNGKGIDDSIRDKIFDPFFTTKAGKGGSGLGLHIVRNIVCERLGGSIAVNPSERGASFRVRLPLSTRD